MMQSCECNWFHGEYLTFFPSSFTYCAKLVTSEWEKKRQFFLSNGKSDILFVFSIFLLKIISIVTMPRICRPVQSLSSFFRSFFAFIFCCFCFVARTFCAFFHYFQSFAEISMLWNFVFEQQNIELCNEFYSSTLFRFLVFFVRCAAPLIALDIVVILCRPSMERMVVTSLQLPETFRPFTIFLLFCRT